MNSHLVRLFLCIGLLGALAACASRPFNPNKGVSQAAGLNEEELLISPEVMQRNLTVYQQNQEKLRQAHQTARKKHECEADRRFSAKRMLLGLGAGVGLFAVCALPFGEKNPLNNGWFLVALMTGGSATPIVLSGRKLQRIVKKIDGLQLQLSAAYVVEEKFWSEHARVVTITDKKVIRQTPIATTLDPGEDVVVGVVGVPADSEQPELVDQIRLWTTMRPDAGYQQKVQTEEGEELWYAYEFQVLSNNWKVYYATTVFVSPTSGETSATNPKPSAFRAAFLDAASFDTVTGNPVNPQTLSEIRKPLFERLNAYAREEALKLHQARVKSGKATMPEGGSVEVVENEWSLETVHAAVQAAMDAAKVEEN